MTSRILTISAALVVLGSAPAVAQTNGWLGGSTAYAGDDYQTSYADAQRQAYDNGYRDGLKHGEQAARDRKPLDIERERDYRGAENGYNRNYGDRNRYRDNYRGGFTQGYRDGYNRYGPNGASDRGVWNDRNRDPRDSRGVWNDRGREPRDNRGRDYGYGNGSASYGAFQNGVSDGYQKGLDDVRDRKYPDATRQKWYRNGDHDYNSRYGSKDAYRVEYRRGFEDGYNRAYRDARY
jgi:hypothetical protein